MPITGYGHIGFVVSDMEKSIDFYCNKLGFEKVTEFGTPERRIVFLKICDGQTVELFSGGTDTIELTKSTIGFAHTCLIVENMQELVEELRAKGVKITSEPRYNDDGSGNFRMVDPDGNEFEMMQRGANSKF